MIKIEDLVGKTITEIDVRKNVAMMSSGYFKEIRLFTNDNLCYEITCDCSPFKGNLFLEFGDFWDITNKPIITTDEIPSIGGKFSESYLVQTLRGSIKICGIVHCPVGILKGTIPHLKILLAYDGEE